MKYLIAASILCLFGACTDGTRTPGATQTEESTVAVADTAPVAAPLPDSVLAVLKTRQVLWALKKQDIVKFASFIHPTLGARFSPYGHIDTVLHQSFLPQELINTSLTKEQIFWGYYDGSGDSINLNVPDYFERFVYNADFLSTGKFGVNKIIGVGNSLNNLEVIYKDANFTESHIPGFDPKYGGMDWTSLRLVYRKSGSELYLVAVVHDQWTI